MKNKAERVVRDGAGSAKLVRWDYNDVYVDLSSEIEEVAEVDTDDLLFVEALRNGGERGAGLRVLERCVEAARSGGDVLVVLALSDQEGGQGRLSAWYARHLERVPSLQNVFSSPRLSPRTTPLEDE